MRSRKRPSGVNRCGFSDGLDVTAAQLAVEDRLVELMRSGRDFNNASPGAHDCSIAQTIA